MTGSASVLLENRATKSMFMGPKSALSTLDLKLANDLIRASCFRPWDLSQTSLVLMSHSQVTLNWPPSCLLCHVLELIFDNFRSCLNSSNSRSGMRRLNLSGVLTTPPGRLPNALVMMTVI